MKEEGETEVEVSQHRVFLLGENRWEEPSRLVGRDKKVGVIKTKDARTKCLSCRGEGRLLCTGNCCWLVWQFKNLSFSFAENWLYNSFKLPIQSFMARVCC